MDKTKELLAISSASPVGAAPTKFGRWDWLGLWAVLTLYAATLAILVPRHEPWFDEAQSWLMARDDGLYDLMTHTLRYEGTPGLWQLLLMVPAKLGLPYASLNWLSALLAIGGVFVFLRFAPFPWLLKAIFPFTFYMLYQYAVIARSYNLLPLFLFSLAALYSRKTERIYSYTALLCLLANVSLHGALIAGSLVLLHLYDLRSQWANLSGAPRVRQVKALIAFGLVGGFLVWQLAPPPDPGFWASWEIHTGFLDVYTRACTLLVGSLTGNSLISALALVVSLWWLKRRGMLRVYLLPAGAVGIFLAVKYCTVFHEGILFLIWIFALWVGFKPLRLPAEVSPRPVVLAMFAVFIFQIAWSISTARLDYAGAYSGGQELARYIKQEGLEDRTIYGFGFQTLAVQPYFDRNLFDNYNGKQGPAFWLWSSKHRALSSPEDVFHGRPDVIIIGLGFIKREQVPDRPGYTRVGVFEGRLFHKGNASDEHDSFLVFRRNGK